MPVCALQGCHYMANTRSAINHTASPDRSLGSYFVTLESCRHPRHPLRPETKPQLKDETTGQGVSSLSDLNMIGGFDCSHYQLQAYIARTLASSPPVQTQLFQPFFISNDRAEYHYNSQVTHWIMNLDGAHETCCPGGCFTNPDPLLHGLCVVIHLTAVSL